MRKALSILAARSRELESDRLYRWIKEAVHKDPRRNFDSFIPIFGLIMTFPFYNMQYLSYDKDRTKQRWADDGAANANAVDRLAEVINAHAREDRTHAALFLRDMRALDLAEVWGINRASTMLWTLWMSPMMDTAQRNFAGRIRALLSVKDEWPPFRYLHVEQLELDGNLLFSAATAKSSDVEKLLNMRPLYFAQHHLDRESGHVGESEFREVVLTPDQAAHAEQVIEAKHALSVEMNELMYRFACAAESRGSAGVMLADERASCMVQVKERVARYVDGQLPAPAWHIRPVTAPAVRSADGVASDCKQAPLIDAWHRHHADFLRHRFSQILGQARGAEATFALRCAALLFAPRICSLHPFYKFDCKTDDLRRGPGTETIDSISDAFATEAQLFCHDWDVLGMDQCIPWDVPTLAEWMFFDPTYGRVELEALHAFRRETVRINDDPLIKYWAMLSMHFMSRAFFAATAPPAHDFEQRHPELLPLVYFRGVHHLLYDEAALAGVTPDQLTNLCSLPATDEQVRYILEMMDVFARYGQRQFDNLVKALTVERDKFEFLREG